jgi:hypothetical protein
METGRLDVHCCFSFHAFVNRGVSLANRLLAAPVLAHHVHPFHVVRVQVVHCFHVVTVPRVREPIHQSLYGSFVIGAKGRRQSGSLLGLLRHR